MNNEIKEILDKMRNFIQEPNEIKMYGISFLNYEVKQLLDYITNLEQVNERLKEEHKHIFANVNDDELLISNAMNYAEAQDYKSRCEKASEYINRNKQKTICAYGDNEDDDFEICLWEEDIDILLNILQNGSDSQ